MAKRSMGVIIEKMEQALNREKPPRLTALRGLQIEEQGDPFKILIGTILSARTRDENTTRVLNRLFARFSTPQDLASADIDEIRKTIHSIGFYNVKAARIKEVSQMLISKFGGLVPSDIDSLLELPGVGRKTANCVLVYGFRRPAIPVDTHVHRIFNRLGVVKTKTPDETEQELTRIVDRKDWLPLNEVFVKYGQLICKPIGPKCSLCPLNDRCEWYRENYKNKN